MHFDYFRKCYHIVEACVLAATFAFWQVKIDINCPICNVFDAYIDWSTLVVLSKIQFSFSNSNLCIRPLGELEVFSSLLLPALLFRACRLKQTVVGFGLFRCHYCNSNSMTPQFWAHALSQVLLFCRPSCFCHLSSAWKRQQNFEF